MSSPIEVAPQCLNARPNLRQSDLIRPAQRSTVVVVAPPWPQSGAAWVIKNQIEHYRRHGFKTVLVIVPFHRWFMRENPVWEEVKAGFRDIGADELYTAPLDESRYTAAKYKASLLRIFGRTALYWEFAMARSARIPNELIDSLRTAPVALIQANYVQTLGFAKRLRRKLKTGNSRIPLIIETHDVQSHLLVERKEPNPWTHKTDAIEKMIRSERSLLKDVDVLAHLSVDDLRFFKEQLPEKQHILVLPTITDNFISSVQAASPLGTAIDLLFVGQKHAPNAAALKWFLTEVWPLLAEKNYCLRIVGPVDILMREQSPDLLDSFSACFVGRVDDLAPYYRTARCVIAPMVSGSGTSIKTIEALALGKPFVGTSKAFRGMPTVPLSEAGIRAYDTPREFASAVTAALSQEKIFAERSLHAYRDIFSQKANQTSRDAVVTTALGGQRVDSGTVHAE